LFLFSFSTVSTLCDFGYIALDVRQICPEDSGVYTFNVSNRLGAISDSIKIQVTPIKAIQTDSQYADTLERLAILERGRPTSRADVDEPTAQSPVVTKPLHQVYHVYEGDSAHLECRIIPVNDPALKIEWYKSGKPLPHSNRMNLINDFGFVSLDIKKIESKDCGVYEVRVWNDLGEARTATQIVVHCEDNVIHDTANVDSLQTIHYLERKQTQRLVDSVDGYRDRIEKPHFIASLRGPEIVQENGRAVLECRVEPVSDPRMNYTWYKNGAELPVSNRSKFSTIF